MNKTSWSVARRVRHAARDLDRAQFLIEAAVAECDRRQEDHPLPTASIRRAKGEIQSARQTIEQLQILSFTAHCRFFRLFECLEECLDYAMESMTYSEFEAARIDLDRSVSRTRDASNLLTNWTGVKTIRLPFMALSRRFAISHPHELAVARKPSANVIHLFPAADAQTEAVEHPTAVLL